MNRTTIKFEEGFRTTYCGLYGGSYTVEVVGRTNNTVTMRSYWIAEDTGEECHEDETHEIELHRIAKGIYVERYEVYEYRGSKAYVPAADINIIDYIMEHGEMPKEPRVNDDWFDDADFDGYYYYSSGSDYSPSCPWNAPGMSPQDFI